MIKFTIFKIISYLVRKVITINEPDSSNSQKKNFVYSIY